APFAPSRYNVPPNVLPPERGMMLTIGDPTSASPRLPKLEITISTACMVSGRYCDVPEVPDPTPTPATWRRPVSGPLVPAPPYADRPAFMAGTRIDAMLVAVRAMGMSVRICLLITCVCREL